MRVDIGNEYITLKEVYSGILFETQEGNRLAVCMRDDTFEINILPKGQEGDNWHSIDMKTGEVFSLKKAKPPDPWKSLKPGERVLVQTTAGPKMMTVKANDGEKISFDGITAAPIRDFRKNPEDSQILLSGPFDASRLKVGEFAWCSACNAWVPKIAADGFDHGTFAHYHLHFQPPENKVEKAVEKATNEIWSAEWVDDYGITHDDFDRFTALTKNAIRKAMKEVAGNE